MRPAVNDLSTRVRWLRVPPAGRARPSWPWAAWRELAPFSPCQRLAWTWLVYAASAPGVCRVVPQPASRRLGER